MCVKFIQIKIIAKSNSIFYKPLKRFSQTIQKISKKSQKNLKKSQNGVLLYFFKGYNEVRKKLNCFFL
jgi:hypothetical protein